MLFLPNRLIQGNHLTPSSNSSNLIHTNIILEDSKFRLFQPYKHHLALISRASAIAIATRKRLHESCQDANIHAMVLVLTAIIPRDWCRTWGRTGLGRSVHSRKKVSPPQASILHVAIKATGLRHCAKRVGAWRVESAGKNGWRVKLWRVRRRVNAE